MLLKYNNSMLTHPRNTCTLKYVANSKKTSGSYDFLI